VSLQSITDNIDTQLASLAKALQACEQQLADCEQAHQPILEREIAALKNTRAKLIKSRTLAIQAFELRQRAEQPPPTPGRAWLWRSVLILVVALIAALATLIIL
jgi:hypothetical protein